MTIIKLRAVYSNQEIFYFDGEYFVNTDNVQKRYKLEKIDCDLDWNIEACINGDWIKIDKEVIK